MHTTSSLTEQNITADIEFLKVTELPASVPPAAAKSYAELPDTLKTRDNWVCFRYETIKGKKQKRPWSSDCTAAKSNTPSTWSSFKDAVHALSIPVRKFDGISFMLLGTPYIGFDFDGVVKDGVLDRYVVKILRVMGDPYAEVSPSGTGLRVFVDCPNLPRPKVTQFKESGHGVEIFYGGWSGKALTVTGNRYSGTAVPTITPGLFELVHLLCSQIHNEKFKALWLGDTSAYGSDHSSADEALCCRLARLLNYNAEKIDAVFRYSGLVRPKWTDNSGYYSNLTIKKAIEFEKSRNPQADKNTPAEIVRRLASDITPEIIEWLWDKRIPMGKIALFAGNPDNAKSLAATSVAAICSTGRDFPDGSQNTLPPSEVLMLIGEDDEHDTVVPRLMAAGADMTKIHLPEGIARSNNSDSELRLDIDLPALEAYLEKYPGIKLIIVDPISNYLGDVSMIAEQDVRRSVLTPLKKVAARYGVAFINVMHLNKKSELDAISRVGGAMAFIGVSRSSWLFTRDAADDGKPSDNFSMSPIKNNLVKASGGLAFSVTAKPIQIGNKTTDVPYVVWGDVIQKSADEALDSRHQHRQGERHRPQGTDDKFQVAVQFLTETLADGAKPATDIIDEARNRVSVSKRTLDYAKKTLNVVVRKDARIWVWELPKTTSEDPVAVTVSDGLF
jgi:putative DNA primase/helicase